MEADLNCKARFLSVTGQIVYTSVEHHRTYAKAADGEEEGCPAHGRPEDEPRHCSGVLVEDGPLIVLRSLRSRLPLLGFCCGGSVVHGAQEPGVHRHRCLAPLILTLHRYPVKARHPPHAGPVERRRHLQGNLSSAFQPVVKARGGIH